MYRDNFGSVKKIWVDETVLGKIRSVKSENSGVTSFCMSLIDSYNEKKEKRLSDGSCADGDEYASCIALYVPEYLKTDLKKEFLSCGLDEIAEQIM